MSTDRYWDSSEGRWVYDGAECTCDLMAHPCDIHDTSHPATPGANPAAEALRDAANHYRWRNPEHRHVRLWLRERADQIEEED